MQEFKEHQIEWNDEKVARLWGKYSRTYPYNENYFTKGVGKDILKRTEKIIGSLNNKVILDFGCGPGFFIEHMLDLKIKPKKYIGLDFSEESVLNIDEINNVSFKKEGVFIQKLPSDIKNNSVDVCFLIEVVEHLNDGYLDETLKEIYRVLKVDGQLIITTPNRENLELLTNFCPDCGCIYHKYQHVRTWGAKSLEEKLMSYNFKAIKLLELKFKSSNISFISKLKYFINNLLGKNKTNLYGGFQKLK